MENDRKFLNQSLGYNKRDLHVWFNLARFYFNNDKIKALEFINKVLAMNPDYEKVEVLRQRLINTMK